VIFGTYNVRRQYRSGLLTTVAREIGNLREIGWGGMDCIDLS
jgi:hypothetical protein